MQLYPHQHLFSILITNIILKFSNIHILMVIYIFFVHNTAMILQILVLLRIILFCMPDFFQELAIFSGSRFSLCVSWHVHSGSAYGKCLHRQINDIDILIMSLVLCKCLGQHHQRRVLCLLDLHFNFLCANAKYSGKNCYSLSLYQQQYMYHTFLDYNNARDLVYYAVQLQALI